MYSITPDLFVNHESKNQPSDLIKSLPFEVCLEIFSHLSRLEMVSLTCINKDYQVLAGDETIWKNFPSPKLALGKAFWSQYFGKVTQPSLPKNIDLILSSPCPFTPGKNIEETHRLLLIPGSVDGKPLTLNLLLDLMKTPKKGIPFRYSYIWEKIIEIYGQQELSKSYWILMTKNVLEESKNKNYQDQQILLTEMTKNQKLIYKAPTLLEAMICAYARFATKEGGLGDSWPYTACEEVIQGYRMMTGGFAPAGIDTFDPSRPRCYIGLAPVIHLS